MNTRKSIYLMISLFLAGCGAMTAPTATPIQAIPTLPSPEDATPTATVFIPTLATATIEVLEQTNTPQPTDTMPVLQMEIVEEPGQTPILQPAVCQSPPQNWVIYTVQRNDTLSSLGQRTGSSWQQIQTANCLASTTIFAGQRIYLPYVPQPPVSNNPSVTELIPITPLPPSVLTKTPPTPVVTIESPPAPGPGDPNLAVTPKQGPAGTKFIFTLNTFTPGETVTFIIKTAGNFQEIYKTTVQVSSLGNALVTYQSPDDADARTYFVQALGGKSASTDFTITSP
jgi:hypothetical protein